MSSVISPAHITGIILAGGRSRRLQGQDKGLLPAGQRTLVEHVIARLQPQLDTLCINANRNLDQYRQLGLSVFTDDWQEYAGPLAGFYSATRHCPGDWFLTCPCDTPFLPDDLVARMSRTACTEQVPVVTVSDGQYTHGTICLFHRDCSDSLLRYHQQGQQRVQEWIRAQSHAIVDYSDQAAAFMNINTAEQLRKLVDV